MSGTSVAMAVIHASMHSSIRMGAASYLNRTRQASKIATAADRSSASRVASSHSSNASSLTADTPARRYRKCHVDRSRDRTSQIGRRGRFFAWIGRNRRLAKDFEAIIDSARAFLYAASVMLLVRRIARAS